MDAHAKRTSLVSAQRQPYVVLLGLHARKNVARRQGPAPHCEPKNASFINHSTCERLSTRAACAQKADPVAAVSYQPLRVMIAGAPAAGKGTQCAKIVEKYGLVHISVGDLLRAEVASGTPAGLIAKGFMDNGDLVPNEVVVDMVKNKLAEEEVQKNGWLLDGYPRSGEQAEAIDKEGIRPDIFLLIEVPDDLLIERVVGRRSDPETGEIYHLVFKPPPAGIISRLVQRSDDTEEKARNRLRTYHANVNAVLGFYGDQLVKIDGTDSMEAVFETINEAIEGVRRVPHSV